MRRSLPALSARLTSSTSPAALPHRAVTLSAGRCVFASPSSSLLHRSFTASVESRVSSEGSHSDFSGRAKPAPASASASAASASAAASSSSSSAPSTGASALISSDVSGHPVFLYMKGSPASPKCGFSANVVRILQHLGASFSSRDVLEDSSVRDAVKQYSDWPTLPQLYVKGEFVGGSDIITQMFKSGELEKVLQQAGVIQQAAAASTAAAGGADSKLAQ